MLSIEEKPLSSQWYVYDGGRYSDRDDVICVLTVTYTHQGERIYITGTHDGEIPTGFREAVKAKAVSMGVRLIEWEHRGKFRTESLV